MIKVKDNFANLSKWTVVQTAGSVAVSGNEVTLTPGGGNVDPPLTGIVLANKILLEAGDIVTSRINPSSTAGANEWLGGGLGSLYPHFEGVDGIDLYCNGGAPTVYAWDHPSTTSIGTVNAAANNDVKYVAGTGAGNVFVDLYLNGSNLFTTSNYDTGIGTLSHYKLGVGKVNGTSDTLKFSRFMWTDVNGTTPNTPTGIDAVVSGNDITVTWGDNGNTAESVDYYAVERSLNGGGYSEIAQVPFGTPSYLDLNLDPGAYSYRVRAAVNPFSTGVIYSSYDTLPPPPRKVLAAIGSTGRKLIAQGIM